MILTDEEKELVEEVFGQMSIESVLSPKARDLISQWYVAWVRNRYHEQEIEDGR